MQFVLFLLGLVAGRAAARETDFCFVDEDEPYLYMATKTAYHFVRSGKTGFQTVPNCQPLQIWMLAVHGTRYPTSDEIDQMYTLLELRDHIVRNHETRSNGRMCNRDLENLKRWKLDEQLTQQMAEVLTPQGVEDMKLLAGRLQSNFRDLLPSADDGISSTHYKFKTSTAHNSMEYFMEGLFGSRTAVVPEESPANGSLLSTHRSCSLWNDPLDSSVDSEQIRKFDGGPQFENLLHNVSRRLGFLYNISTHSIVAMYNMCRYEKAWSVTRLSPWCAVFSKDELRVLEYREDLYYYHHAGYGRDINARLGCPLLQDMMHGFWKLVKGEDTSNEPRGIFYFTDAVSFQNFLTSLGVARDQTELSAFNYNEMARRQWRTSFVSPFAANLVAVFYKCNDVGSPNKVMFYLAEKPVLFDGCEVGLCDWTLLTDKYGSLASDCKLDVCSRTSGGQVQRAVDRLALFLACLSLVLVRH